MYETVATIKDIYLLRDINKEEIICNNADHQLNSKIEGNIFSRLVTRQKAGSVRNEYVTDRQRREEGCFKQMHKLPIAM